MNPEIPPRPRALAVLRRRSWLIAVCLVLGGAAAYLAAHSEVREYSASSTLLFEASQLDERIFGTSYTPTYVDPSIQAQTNLDLVSLSTVASLTSRALNGHPSAQAIADSISTSAQGNSSLVNVVATWPSASEAARIATAYAESFVAYRRQAEQSEAIGAAKLIQSQLSALPLSAQNSSEADSLRTRINQLHVLASLQTGDVQVAQPASVPVGASSPRTKRDLIFGALAGLIVGLIGVGALERFDRKLADVDDARRVLQLPVLASIPLSRGLDQTRPAREPSPADLEVYRHLRLRLRYFNVDKELRSILVTSPTQGDGKTTTAWHLALAAAEISPEATVLFLEADLRRPSLASMGVIAPRPGLSEVLSGNAEIVDAIFRIPVAPYASAAGPYLHVLTAGQPPPNPTALMESNRMVEVLAALLAAYDFVVIDAPPISFVSDAIPLLYHVDGTIIVARIGNTDRDAARLTGEQLAEFDTPVLGLVINGVKSLLGDYYGYGSGSSSSPKSDASKRTTA